ncbi:lamin tail domain-containing protein [Halopelagius longus]|uniref:Competence protein ComEC n=1 Tax=Halopelagius longus TaxID=1236180 RepID=A0A1H0YAC3_9EURY|nr:lamin tail domain-containing protein [Halopelagius longus]RDI72373.1 MBL fold metallo-hydrolase [Halopelagius longus]SDQ12013.1 competence protein ComEC [Halopelagius longus]
MIQSRAVVTLVVVLSLVVAGGVGPGSVAATPEDAATATNGTDPDSTPSSSVAGGNGSLEIHFINVGQGASILVVSPSGETMLIDTGDWRDDGADVLQYLERENVSRIDHLVTTHADADHIGGHAAVIDRYETEKGGVGAVYDPGIAASSDTYQRYLNAVERHDVPLYEVAANDTIPFAGVNATVLAPPETPLADGDRNENSVVLSLRNDSESTGYLFPGDAEDDGEAYLTRQYGERLNATVLQAGHHGSRSSTSDALLDESSPRVVVVSSAYDSRYGHPHNETLERLASRSVSTYWTATHGNVVLVEEGDELVVKTQQNATTNPLELRSGSPVEPGTGPNVTERSRLSLATAGDGNGTATDTATETETATETATETPEPTPTPTATPTPSPSEPAEISLAEVNADAAGDESENLDDEYVVFENTGDSAADLSGWTVEDGAGHTYAFPDGFTLDAGESVTLRTGAGDDTETDLYWGSQRPVWNNGGDTVTVTDASGTVVVEETYP